LVCIQGALKVAYFSYVGFSATQKTGQKTSNIVQVIKFAILSIPRMIRAPVQLIMVKPARDIWQHPQLGMEETYAVKRQTEALDRDGFSDHSDLGGMSTAFSASWGHGRPVIGVLGEYDALPGRRSFIQDFRI